jgi:YegS/Rv2252/BmrU family lipid kinase
MNALPVAPRRPLVIFNPTAGNRRRRRLERFLSALRAGGASPRVCETRKVGDARAFACSAAAAGNDAVLVAGGDGTINEAINGLLDSGAALPLGLLPLGTANVLAIELGLPRRPAAAAAVVLRNRRLPICLGVAGNRAFALMAGIGFDAAVVANLDPARKRRLRQGAYALETIVQAFRFGFPRYQVVTAEGARFEARSVIACRASRYGGPFTLAPRASLQRSTFTLVLFESAGPLAVLRFSFALLLGRMHACRGVRMVETAGAEIAGPVGEAAQGDGDLIATLPLRLAVRPAALEILIP